MAAALFTEPTRIAIFFFGLFARPIAATLPALAIATVAYNIYQAIGKAQAVRKAATSAA